MNTLITVVSVVGQVWAVAANGARRLVQEGEQLLVSETLVLAPGAQVNLDFGDNRVVSLVGEQTSALEPISGQVAQMPNPEALTNSAADDRFADDNSQPQATSGGSVMTHGHRFVQLVRIAEVVESDGLTPLTVARIHELLRPLGMGYPSDPIALDDWREHRGGDERDEDFAARSPGVDVVLQGAGDDGIYNADEIGSDGSVSALVTLDNQVRPGDKLIVTDGSGTVLLDRLVTEQDLRSGLVVEVPVLPGQTEVVVTATVSDGNRNTATSEDQKPVDNLAPEPLVGERQDADSDQVDLDLNTYFNDASTLEYDVQGLPPGLAFDPETGRVTGTLTPSASQGGDESDGVYSVTIGATDPAGNRTEHVLTWTVTNPAPVAQDDTNSIAEDGVAIGGNLITGEGADNGAGAVDSDLDGDELTVVGVDVGPGGGSPEGNIGSPLAGQYGELTLNADGSYSYELDNGNPLVDALKDGETLTEVFTYRISDGEGGEDTATLTITINGRTDGVPGVSVDDLNGLETGSNSIAEDATAPVAGTFIVTAPDGLNQITVGGVSVTAEQLANLGTAPVVITGTEGELTLTGFDAATGEVSYSYQQSGSAKDHSAGDDSVTDRFAITVTDNGNDVSAPSDLVILITDTAPEANADSNSVTEDSTTPATGNVISDSGTGQDELGADATTVTGVSSGNVATELSGSVGSNVAGSYGTLVLGSDGEYSYVLDDSNAEVNALKDGETLTDTFSYTIKDADGDWSTTTLTITIDGNTDGTPSITPADDNGNGAIDGDNTVRESGLAGGSSAGDDSHITNGSIEISAGDGLASVT
ncbi:VCBS domain-containing protein, partial [Aeromonas caviae]